MKQTWTDCATKWLWGTGEEDTTDKKLQFE